MIPKTRIDTLNKRLNKVNGDDQEKVKAFIKEIPIEVRRKYGIKD